MSAFNFKHLIIGLVMIAAAGLALALTPKEMVADQGPKIDLETMIPKQFGEWKVDESVVPVQISPDVQAALNKIYNQTLSRTYINNQGERIMLSIAYGGDQADNLSVHLPEGCYKGQGFAVGDKIRGLLNTPFGNIPVSRLVANKGQRNEPITYWIVVGNQTTNDGWAMKKAKLSYALKGQVPDGILIRVSSISNDPEKAYALQTNFADTMLGAMPPNYRMRLMGSGNG